MTIGQSAQEVSQDQLVLDASSVESFISDLNQKYPDKIIYLDFWASWCGPCRKSFPFMNKLQTEFANDLLVLAVNEDDDRSLAERFLKKYPANFEILFDPNGQIATVFDLAAMPSSYIISKNGELIGKHTGFRKGDDVSIEAALKKYIQQTKLKNIELSEDAK